MTSVEVDSVSDVSRLVDEIFGADLATETGSIHVAAVVNIADRLHVLRITPDAPKSTLDSFVLSMSRARAEFIVTTGRILREEPDLTHDYLGSAENKAAFAAWRREVVGLEEPPGILILTSGRNLSDRHPVFAGPRPVTICTSVDGAAVLHNQAFPARDIVAMKKPTLRKVIRLAMGRQANTVSIEAGPSTVATLYQSPVILTEVLLSRFHGDVAMSLVGGSFVAESELHRRFRFASSYRINESDGDWSFLRLVR